MQDLKLYIVSDQYIDYLRRNVSSHVFSNSEPYYIHSRKYLGVVFSIGKYNYHVPISSPKQSDYLVLPNGSSVIRKSIVPIMRIVETDQSGNKTLLGTLKFSNMIPVPDGQLSIYDLPNEPDRAYRNLVEKEVRFINRHTPEILKSASVLYRQKITAASIGYLKSTLDFQLLEQACDQFPL